MAGGIITAAVRHLMAAGVIGEALLAAIADMEAAPGQKDEQAERRRARDRSYQSSRRQKSAESAEVADPSPNDIYSNPHPTNPSPDGDGALAVVSTWNEMAGRTGLRAVVKLNAHRRKLLNARLAEHGRETLIAAIAKIEASDFCLGRTGKGDGWRANFDFLLSQSRCLRLIEGNYDNHGADAPRSVKIWQDGERESQAMLHETRTTLPLAEWEKLRDEHFRQFGGSRDPPERRGGVVELGRLPSVRRATG